MLGIVLTGACLVWGGIVGSGLAQEPSQQPLVLPDARGSFGPSGASSAPAAPPSAAAPAQEPAVAKPPLRVAKETNVSLSIDVSGRVGAAVATLHEKLINALKSKPVDAALVTASDSKYVPPGDDEIALADAGIGADDIVARIGSGYADSPAPLALMTVDERGGYVIAAAYVFDDENGKKSLKRVSRLLAPAARVDLAAVDAWPMCFAEAISRHLKNPPAADDAKCQQNASRAPAPPAAQNAGRVPVLPPPQPAAPAQRKPTGMLDDVQDSPGVMAVIPPPASAKPPAKPAPQVAAKPPVATPPQQTPTPGNPLVIVPPAVASAPAVIPPNGNKHPRPGQRPGQDEIASLLSAPASVSGHQLYEQVYASGFVWRPNDTRTMVSAISKMGERNPGVGDCLARQRNEYYGTEQRLLNAMVEEFQQGRYSATRKVLNPNLYEITFVPQPSDQWTPRSCFSPKPINQFSYSVLKAYSFGNAMNELTKLNSKETRVWRLPTALEGFAIATALIYSPDSDQIELPISFWTDRDQHNVPGIVTITRNQNVSFEAEAAESKTTARLLVVFQ